jgi:hypothetical protein
MAAFVLGRSGMLVDNNLARGGVALTLISGIVLSGLALTAGVVAALAV